MSKHKDHGSMREQELPSNTGPAKPDSDSRDRKVVRPFFGTCVVSVELFEARVRLEQCGPRLKRPEYVVPV